MKNNKIKSMTMVAVMTAVMCVLGPMSIPIGPVPVSFTVLTVYLAVYILGMKHGSLAYLIYLLLGLVGLPVLSGYSGGPSKLLGPTGGYLLGFLLMALLSGFFIDRFYHSIPMQLLGMLSGLLICYALGTIWLSRLTGMGFAEALGVGVFPFVVFDIIKLAVSVFLGRAIRKRLRML